jgi:2-dehydropantoate 2-reductase
MGAMRYIIIGAGAIGGTIGGRLFAAGHEVVLVARGTHLDALRDRGLRLGTPEGTQLLRIPAVSGPHEVQLQPSDTLVVAVKTQDAAAVFDEWAGRPVGGGAVAADTLPLVCAQNGVASERIALRRFRHVYGICVWLPATHLKPGVVEAYCTPLSGLLHIGRYPAGSDATADRIATDLTGGGFLAPVTAEIMRWKYGKLLGNLRNAAQAVCGLGTGDLGAVAEGTAVLTAAGIPYASAQESAELRGDRVNLRPVNGTRHGGGSSWQSLARGTGSIEADFLNGEIVLLGRQHGIPTPVNEVMQRLANQAAGERRPPGSISADEVLALIGRTEANH